nr:unnamed protein product [Callosobruchus analis]
MCNDKQSGIVMFSTTSNLNTLCCQEIILLDGTFDYCCKYFLQMFTIHTYVNNMYIPLVYCLLKDKRKQSYNEVMSIIKNKCLELGLLFRPRKVVSDFEKAIHSCILQCFPTTEIIGCRFHLMEYKDTSSIVGRYLHYFFGLTFLDPHEVGDAFVELMEELPQDRRISEFCDYLVVEYKDTSSIVGRYLHYFFGLTFLDPHEVGDAFVELMEELPQDRRISEFCDYLVGWLVGLV